MKWLIAYMLGSVGDAVTTWIGLRGKFVEGNPMSVVNVLPSPLLLPLVEFPFAVGVYVLLKFLGEESSLWLARLCWLLLCALRFYPVIHNLILLLM